MLKSRGFWIGVAVSLIFIGLFVRSTDLAEVKQAFEEANYWLALLSLPVYFLGLWMRTLRWQYLLRPVKKVSGRRLYPVVIIGLMANNLLPARVGELARAYVLGERENISKSASLGTIAVDRLFDGLTLVPLLLIVAAFAGGDTYFPVGFGKELNFAGLGIVMAVLFGIAITILFYFALSKTGHRLLHQLVHRFTPSRFKSSVEGILNSFIDGLQALRNPIDLALAFVMSLASWLLEATMYYIVARAFHIDEPFYVFVLLCAAANLAIAIIASQGGIGPFELVVSKTVVAFGAPAQLASAYAIGLHALLIFPIVIIGLYLMWSMDLGFGDMLSGGSKTKEEPAPVPVNAAASEDGAAAGRVVLPARPAVEGTRK